MVATAMHQATSGRLLRMAGNTGLVALGTAFGQFFTLVSTPYLTRRHAPAEFGQLALVFTLTSIVVAAGCLRYDLALPVAEDRETIPLYLLCLGLALVLGGGLFAAARLPWSDWFHHPITHLLGSPWIMLLVVLGVATYQAAGAILVREGLFPGLALLRMSQGLLFSTIACLSLGGLIWAHVLSYLVGGLAVGAIFLGQTRGSLGLSSAGQVLAVAGTYRDFPVYSLPGALLDVAGFGCSIWIISSAFGLESAGHYSQVQRLLGAPMLLASMSLSQVMMKQSADELKAGRSLWPLVKDVGLALAALAGVLFLGLLLWGPQAMRLMLGSGWRVDRYFVCLVAFAVFIRTIVSPLSSILIVTQRFRAAFLWQVAYFVSTVTILPWFAHHLTFDGFILGFAGYECVHYTSYFLIIRAVARG